MTHRNGSNKSHDGKYPEWGIQRAIEMKEEH